MKAIQKAIREIQDRIRFNEVEADAEKIIHYSTEEDALAKAKITGEPVAISSWNEMEVADDGEGMVTIGIEKYIRNVTPVLWIGKRKFTDIKN
jgi:hypothetical protein